MAIQTNAWSAQRHPDRQRNRPLGTGLRDDGKGKPIKGSQKGHKIAAFYNATSVGWRNRRQRCRFRVRGGMEEQGSSMRDQLGFPAGWHHT